MSAAVPGAVDPFDDLLASGPWPIDGGLASELDSRGHDLSGHLWSAKVLRESPAAIRAVHAAYLDAGARVVVSASYQASRQGYARIGLDAAAADALLTRSVQLAREAVAEHQAAGGGRALVAASVGPYGAIGHDGGEYRGRYGLTHQELIDFHRTRLDVLAAAEPDLLAVETIPDADEAAALVEVLAGHPDLPAWITFSCCDAARTCAGQPVAEAFAVAAAAPTVRAVGVNCTAPEYVGDLLAAAGDIGLPLVAYPNAGRGWDPVAEEWTGEGVDLLPDPVIREWVADGAILIGGCCGLGPAAVAALADTLADLRAR